MDLPIASIDVGSGMTKFVIAILRRSAHNNRSIQVIEQIEKPIPYGVDLKSSNDGFLSQEIQLQGLKLFHDIRRSLNTWKNENCSKYYGIDVVGVGTEVFRKAKNGQDFLKLVESETDIKIDLISQEREAIIGFRTGEAALMTIDSDVFQEHFDFDYGKELVVYDSGGGSTQITWIGRNRKTIEGSSEEERLEKVLKPYGLAQVLQELLMLQNKKQKDTPNPVTFETAMDLTDSLISQFIDPKDISNTKDANGKPFFLSIGGINSHVRLAADVTNRIEIETRNIEPFETVFELEIRNAESLSAKDRMMNPKSATNVDITPRFFTFTEDSVTRALKRICNKKDDDLKIFTNYENAEPVSYIVPKLCILLAAIKGYQMSTLHWIMSCGNCFGLILDHCNQLESKDT